MIFKARLFKTYKSWPMVQVSTPYANEILEPYEAELLIAALQEAADAVRAERLSITTRSFEGGRVEATEVALKFEGGVDICGEYPAVIE